MLCMAMIGVLNVNKPAGMSSRAAVDRVERLVRPAKVGHAGTLDPLATGVLVICVGQATRLIQYVQRMPKCYHATFRLGVRSETDDVEGEVVPVEGAAEPSRAALDRVLARFVGEIQQRPPVHSAIKLAGKRAYQLARRGVEVELQPRPVVIYELAVRRYSYPGLELDVKCGSGTYIRSLGRDIGEALGSGAVMTALERTAIGGFNIADSINCDLITPDDLDIHLQPAIVVLTDLPQVRLTEAQLVEICNGRPVMWEWVSEVTCELTDVHKAPSPRPLPKGEGVAVASSPFPSAPMELVALDVRGHLVGILYEKRPGELWPRMNFTESLPR